MGVGAEPDRTVVVDRVAAGGRGVGRVDGVVWLVAGAVPGDTVRARVVRRRSRWVEARTVEVVVPSPDRRRAPCPIQERCGGCPWMALAPDAQRRAKRSLVVDALERIGGLGRVDVDDVVPSPRDLDYRGKIELALARDATVLGFHVAVDAGDLVDVERCAIADPRANGVLATVRAVLRAEPARAALSGGTRERTRVVLRASRSTGEVLVAIRGSVADSPGLRAVARGIAARHPEVVGVVHVVPRPGRRGGARTTPLLGRDWMEEKLAGTRFRIPATSFFQVNPAAAELVVEHVAAVAEPRRGVRALDLYGGLGAHGWRIAADGADVVVCEADADAVACGRSAVPRPSAAPRPRFVRADAARFLAAAAERRERFEIVIANPPRTGLGRGVAAAAARLSPARIVIVSCDPPTLARDLKSLGERGYRLRRTTPFDLFPQTAHVETVCLLTR